MTPPGPPVLSTDAVGARVSVRFRSESGRPTDVVGDLDAMDDDVLVIRRRDGDVVEVPSACFVAGRVVGPSMLSARELEGVTFRSWPAPEREWLGEWCLQAAAGFTFRANSVRPLGAPGLSLDDALARVCTWYAERALPPTVRAIEGSSIDQELRRRGWTEYYPTSLATATIAAVRQRAGERSAEVQLDAEPSASWLACFRGGTTPPVAVDILTSAEQVVFATVVDASGRALAIGRATVEPPWVALSAIEVVPEARRRGLARAVIDALAEWGRARGAARVCLEVLTDNAPALALYGSLGFAVHYRHLYRRAPEPA